MTPLAIIVEKPGSINHLEASKVSEILKKNNLLTLTPNAIARLRDINTNSSSDHTAVKLGVKNGGCAGMAYTMDYINEIKENDEVYFISSDI